MMTVSLDVRIVNLFGFTAIRSAFDLNSRFRAFRFFFSGNKVTLTLLRAILLQAGGSKACLLPPIEGPLNGILDNSKKNCDWLILACFIYFTYFTYFSVAYFSVLI